MNEFRNRGLPLVTLVGHATWHGKKSPLALACLCIVRKHKACKGRAEDVSLQDAPLQPSEHSMKHCCVALRCGIALGTATGAAPAALRRRFEASLETRLV